MQRNERHIYKQDIKRSDPTRGHKVKAIRERGSVHNLIINTNYLFLSPIGSFNNL